MQLFVHVTKCSTVSWWWCLLHISCAKCGRQGCLSVHHVVV